VWWGERVKGGDKIKKNKKEERELKKSVTIVEITRRKSRM
jgi:hypothetical protein